MKIHISFEFKDGPWGGGNQFLKALKDYLIRHDKYSHEAEKADVLLFNSHQIDFKNNPFSYLWKLKKKNPKLIFVHRIDGPITLVRGNDNTTDKMIFAFNSQVADGTIFQTHWSADNCSTLGIEKNIYETTLINSPNQQFFYKKNPAQLQQNKIRLISTSWSANPNKGFDTLQFLDQNLDFSKYSMTFIGNSPIKFKNFSTLPPHTSKDLAEQLRQHDIFFTASKNDPCSNSLIEALHCGLPAVSFNSGGNPEIVGKGGVLFNLQEEVIPAIIKVTKNIESYIDQITLPSMDHTGKAYYRFCEKIVEDKNSGIYQPKAFPFHAMAGLKAKVHWYKKKRLLQDYITSF
jgi:glycosyltransferase involved in cell wall biosynthesis